MSILSSFIKDYQESNSEKFNEDFIYLRQKDSIKDFMDYNCKALEIISGIKYLGSELSTNEYEFPAPNKFLSIEDSRLDLIKVHFRIKAKVNKNDLEEKEEDITLELFFPKLINDFYFRLNGSTYSALYQLIDNGTYSTNKTFTMKTLFMPIIFRTDIFSEETTVEGEIFTGNNFVLDAFKQRINILYYLFAKKGLYEALSFMGLELNEDIFISETVDTPTNDVYHTFQITKNIYIHVLSEILDGEDSVYFTRLILTLINVFKSNRINFSKIFDVDYWQRMLGKCFTKNSNAQIEKALSVLISLERVLDECTKINLLDVDDEDKSDIYSMVRYLVQTFDEHVDIDNMDIHDKRIRLNEYLVYPVIKKFTNKIYRLINSKNITFGKLRSTFNNFGKMYAVRQLTVSELLRYSNCVNQLDLYAAALKFTRRGPQSMNDGGSNTNIKYRGLHPSYLGKVELTAASASDPGMTGTFTPFCKMDDKNSFYFKKPNKE